MLHNLVIQDVLLIDKLVLNFNSGFSVLTGETGAGKSILLDALGLALGERANAGMIRPGSPQAIVSAAFNVPSTHIIWDILSEHGFVKSDESDEVVLRRTLSPDGKSKSFVNDQSVSVGFLKVLAENLLEIHGQFDQLLTPSTHRKILDQYGNLTDSLNAVAQTFQEFSQAKKTLEQARESMAHREQRLEELAYDLEEFRQLNPEKGEEVKLLEARTALIHQDKILEGLKKVAGYLGASGGASEKIYESIRLFDKATYLAPEMKDKLLGHLDKACTEVQEVESIIGAYLNQLEDGYENPQEIDDRLYALRALARKHRCQIDDLCDLKTTLEEEKALLDSGDSSLKLLETRYQELRDQYLKNAQNLRQQRQETAKRLSVAVEGELKFLKLDKVTFTVDFQELSDESDWTSHGADVVEFCIQTNPGLPFGGLGKIASGGERSRIMLALKVILAQTTHASLIVFDEIDSGVGGAVASAIGERLKSLGAHRQVLAITHAPQVAACSHHHYFVQKNHDTAGSTTHVFLMDDQQRREEVARMLAGQEITQEARMAADQLFKTGS